MKFVEVWTSQGWMRREHIFELKASDVYRVVGNGVYGAPLIAIAKVPDQGSLDNWAMQSRLLNQGKTTFCEICDVLLDADVHAHGDGCPICGRALKQARKLETKPRVVLQSENFMRQAQSFH